MIEKLKNFIKSGSYFIGRFFHFFITIHTRPMFSDQLVYEGKESVDDAECGIVIQGPIKKEDNFTVETVKFYYRHYPSATIILSTWEDEDVSAFEMLKIKKLIIIRSPIPYHGLGSTSINLQVTSTKKGIDRAMQAGLKYILKTRTDQRMYGIDSLSFFKNMLECFPVLNCNLQHKRILTVDTGTNRSIPHHLSDFFMFGAISDMKLYWSDSLIIDPANNPLIPIYVESYFFTQFLKKTGWEFKNSMENFMQSLGERCIIVDNESVDVYWHKYTRYREYRLRNYFNPTFGITFKTWFNEAYIPAVRNGGDCNKKIC